MKRDTENKMTLEDLLRLKRAERPAAEFWAAFEAEIRTKQLSAIVSRRPWWDRFSGIFAVVTRHQLSFGAAAAFAMAFAAFRYVSGHPEPVRAPRAAPSAPVAAVAVAPVQIKAEVVTTVAPSEELAAATRVSVPVAQQVVNATASHMTQAPVTLVADTATKSPFVEGIAIKLAEFREPMPDFARPSVFGSDREFEQTVTPSRQVVSEPLARMDPAAERRARLLAPALPAYSSGTSGSFAGDWMRQRASSDDRMYESMDRGSNDDRMLVGFRF
jgi:hypothetical protein